MRDRAATALDAAVAAGAAYADCRVVERTVQSVTIRNGRVNNVSELEDAGTGIRVLVDGAWGFCGTQRDDPAGLEEAARLAVRIARASARTPVARVRLAQAPAVTATYVTPVSIDPFSVTLDRKIDLLLAADAAMDVAGITTRVGSLGAVRHHQIFASTEGSCIEQTIIETGGGLDATATGDGEVQTRSFPNSFGRQQLAAGWEIVEEMDLPGNGTRIAEEAVALLSADPCPSGRMTLILDATQAALQVHESCGHPTELDRVLGFEAAYAGTSFLMPDMLGRFRYGSEQVTITADATSPGGLGTFGYDDEGVAAQRTLLIDRGIFTGYLSSRETASQVDAPSGGTVRAESWNRLPLIRMTNINLEPGTSSLEEMIATTEHGVYLETNRSWSIDDRRLNFQFGTQAGWEIRDGRRVRLVRNPLYSGNTPEFWNSCDAVAGRAEWRMYGVINCGKGQPGQVMHVGHGAAPCRFRNVAVRPA
ncbi:MAG: TldD/PmbA family protein [Candidatus Dormibacteraeota bacterium]|uniref:TldD/PmbA family protein n=1 Tax=Candidatus Amunia macphersoniae TaxID=3127014 RepID=A0A934KP06_9BACT|nr:TldD/PmbA family protein [Candidatus Dormibacteraeota bacterium]